MWGPPCIVRRPGHERKGAVITSYHPENSEHERENLLLFVACVYLALICWNGRRVGSMLAGRIKEMNKSELPLIRCFVPERLGWNKAACSIYAAFAAHIRGI